MTKKEIRLGNLNNLKTSKKDEINMKTYVDYVYDIVKLDCENMDAIYKDYIIQMVGVYGFNALHDARLLEGCGIVNRRYLYVLIDRKE